MPQGHCGHVASLKENEVIVVGTNLYGNHLGGAAKESAEKYGLKQGVGEGESGQAYAFPTLDTDMRQASDEALKASVRRLFEHCAKNPKKTYKMTKVGCGIAGFSEEKMASLFSRNTPVNLELPEGWPRLLVKYLKKGLETRYGTVIFKLGEWQKHDGEVKCGSSGFHASMTPIQAMANVPDDVLACVEVRGDFDHESDKQAWREMRVVSFAEVTPNWNRQMAVRCAEAVLHLFEQENPGNDEPRKMLEEAKRKLGMV